MWYSRNQRRQGTTALSTHTEYYVSSLIIPYCKYCVWSDELFSFLCDVVQGPEGPVGTRGPRGLQVSSNQVVKYATIKCKESLCLIVNMQTHLSKHTY